MTSWCPDLVSPRLCATLALIGASVTLSARLTKQDADQFSAKLIASSRPATPSR